MKPYFSERGKEKPLSSFSRPQILYGKLYAKRPLMAAPKLLLSNLLRRRPQTLASLTSSSYSIFFAQSSNRETPQKTSSGLPFSTVHPLALHYGFVWSRSLSTRGDSDYGRDLSVDSAAVRADEEELIDSGFSSSVSDAGDVDGSEIAEALVSASDVGGDGEPILPVRALISLLDLFHNSTGWPWWVLIASSTLALRITLLPVLIFQLKKSKKIAELLPKLPPPFPPPLSGGSYREQFSLFRKERRAVGCPSYLWLLAYVSVQVPCFLLWMTTIRRMSLDHHPGFDCGGTLWFQNLTDFPHGVSGTIFPLLIASFHFANVQISFRTFSAGKATGLLGLLAQYYKFYLNLLTLPILFTGFCVPQGSLVYWVTNSSLTLVQQLCLDQPGVRETLGLPDKVDPVPPAIHEKMVTPGEKQGDLLRKQQIIAHLSPRELLALSVKHLAEGHKDTAMPLLRLALDKDPEYVRALVVMGQTLLQDEQLAEAAEYLERAISKLFLTGHPTEVEEVDLLILASQWAGIAYIRQGKNAEGIRHLERVANLEEPEDAKSKAHYYDAFLVLASALYSEHRKPEAKKLLRMAAAYDPSHSVYLEQCEKDEVDLVSDLASSRRGD
ncbi:ALBINO3-like protein 2, chloroplastic [Rhododendron vialii]|uniref:ALBINO3-like protein 2, chloroplastic n=1 Tax=Rhododendron vialii TaxID=182163 RepID=UPI00265F4397|nr:ALBINO3-like protein 2, chloroplastic [Rhododendron vialii]